jgi:hypothetical protein
MHAQKRTSMLVLYYKRVCVCKHSQSHTPGAHGARDLILAQSLRAQYHAHDSLKRAYWVHISHSSLIVGHDIEQKRQMLFVRTDKAQRGLLNAHFVCQPTVSDNFDAKRYFVIKQLVTMCKSLMITTQKPVR